MLFFILCFPVPRFFLYFRLFFFNFCLIFQQNAHYKQNIRTPICFIRRSMLNFTISSFFNHVSSLWLLFPLFNLQTKTFKIKKPSPAISLLTWRLFNPLLRQMQRFYILFYILFSISLSFYFFIIERKDFLCENFL